ncbi:MAG TPA: AAA family ATPase [Acidimicrobiales bacterium]|nr:AAA family ATPase [Acidimicrobiales bacterium]
MALDPVAPLSPTAFLGAAGVLRSADVSAARERLRRRRLARLAAVLAVVAVPLATRAVEAVVDAAAGRPGPHGLPFAHLGLPAGAGPYLPSIVLMGVLVVVLALPMLGAGRSPHVLYRPEEIDVRLSDVVGAEPVVEEVVKTLNLFLAHKTFKDRMGGTPRRAILFEGPPGTGKTHIAKAMAGEAGVPFLFVSSSAFQSMFYGQTNRKIRSYFKALRTHARREGGAIGFIEEIDAIGASRSGMGGQGREGVAGVVNELLIQLQSFDAPTAGQRVAGGLVDLANRWLPAGRRLRKPRPTPANILLVGATNRAQDLDPALLRPGRFDRTVTVDVPSRAGRRAILDYYLDRKAHGPDLDDPAKRDALAAMTFGYSPVMLEHLLDEALVWALRRGADRLGWDDVQRAKMTEELGLAQPVAYAEGERRTIATHEAGHATVAWLVARHRKLEVLSIIKRSASLGLLAHSEAEERWTRTRSEVEHLLRIAFGGMIAEELFFGETSTGVAGDLSMATDLAAGMVGAYGMAGRLRSLEAVRTPGGANLTAKVLSDDDGAAAVEAILVEARDEVRGLLGAYRHLVEGLRDALLEREELIGDEIVDVLAAAAAAGDARVVDLTDAAVVAPPVAGA